tara:strand:+ start:1264 stop:2862 length:1599 start_codon:yes stop_codon:yes gene_type:complete
MTILPFSHQLLAQNDDISVFLNPYYSQRILAWENNTTNQVSTWQIDISYGTEVNGTMTYEPVLQFFQSKNYLKLADEYVNNPNYFYKITGIDANGNSIGTTNSARTCSGCNLTAIGDPQKCNAPDYAYEIQQYNNTGVTPSYHNLVMDETISQFDITNNTATYFYWFMTANNYYTNGGIGQYTPTDYHIIEFNTSVLPTGMKIKGPLGGFLNPGTTNTQVVGIQKKMKGTPALNQNYENYKNKPIGQLAAPIQFDYATYQLSVNTTVANPVTWPFSGTFQHLECTADPNQAFADYNKTGSSGGGGGTGGGPGFPVGNPGVEFIQGLTMLMNGGSTLEGPVIPKSSDFNLVLEQSSALNTSNTYRLTASDIVLFDILDLATNTRTVIDPSTIEDANGKLSLANYSFTGGLYRANIMYQNNMQTIPFYFEGDNSQTASNGLSNFLNVTIYPVPVINNNFTLSMTASKNLVYTYQMLDMNGNIYTEKQFEVANGEVVKFFNDYDPNIAFINSIIVNKFIFEDGSTLVIQSIIAPH